MPHTMEGRAMRVMVLVKATAESEAGIMPSRELLEAMGKVQPGAARSCHSPGWRRSSPFLEGQAGRFQWAGSHGH